MELGENTLVLGTFRKRVRGCFWGWRNGIGGDVRFKQRKTDKKTKEDHKHIPHTQNGWGLKLRLFLPGVLCTKIVIAGLSEITHRNKHEIKKKVKSIISI